MPELRSPGEYTGRVDTSKPGTGGGWLLPTLVEGAISAIGSFFAAKASRPEGEDWAARLRMEKELLRLQNRLPDWAYQLLKTELSKQLGPHGGGGPGMAGIGVGVSGTARELPRMGGFRELSTQLPQVAPTGQTVPGGRPGVQSNMRDYFTRG